MVESRLKEFPLMNATMPAAAVESFVRKCLGCGCPAAVFESVESDIREHAGQCYQRLRIGGRLLVYLLSDADSAKLPGQLDQLLRAGIAERDAAGYNRLRIVVPDRPDAVTQGGLLERFAQTTRGDEKVHLHFVPRETLECYLGNAPSPRAEL
jgi:hypothetical protein